jgi:23S rRNA pseudouridine1911/1915/1917 synthase
VKIPLKIIYEDADLLVCDKPAGLIVFQETNTKKQAANKTLIDLLIEKYPELKNAGEPPRYGIVHRLDKDTSGLILVAKTNEALFFLQKQFSASAKALADKKNITLEKTIEKRYIALVVGDIKENFGSIETLIGRSPKDGKKQKVFLSGEPGSQNKRQAITEYKVLERFTQSNNSAKGGIAAKRHLTRVNGYTLLEVIPKTGRKHQIRCHLAYLGHPIVGDKMYGFKNQPCPKELKRHFLHASYLKFKLPNGELKEIRSELPEDLKVVLLPMKSRILD